MRIEHPSLAPDDQALADDIHSWLTSDRDVENLLDDGLLRGRVPSWYSELLSNLTLLSSQDTVEGVFTAVDHSTWIMSVHVVTTRRVIEAHTSVQPDARDLQCRAVSRNGVREVRTEEPLGLVGRESRRAWPGAFAVVVTLDGFDEPLTFAPNRMAAFGARQPDMGALTRSFLVDLDG